MANQKKIHTDLSSAIRGFGERVSDFFWQIDENAHFTYISPSLDELASELTGPLKGRLITSCFNCSGSDTRPENLSSIIKSREKFKRCFVQFEDTENYFSLNGTPRWSEEGKYLGYWGIGSDWTDQIATEEAIKESEERFKTIAESASDWFWETDENLRFTFISNRFFEVAKIDLNQVIGKTRLELINERNWNQAPEFWKQHLDDLENRRPFKISYPIFRDDGSTVHITINGKPRFNLERDFIGYLGAGTDITEQVETQLALKTAKEEAEKANRAKSEFLSQMSHELRTPLNSILGFSQLLKNGTAEGLTTEQNRFVDQIVKAGDHLLELIDEILDLAKVEAGKVDLLCEKVLPDDAIKNALDLVRPLADKNQISLHFESGVSRDFSISTDPTRLTQVLVNLLSNAVKYNKPKGEVSIHWKVSSLDTVRFAIQDTGHGISENDQGSLFAPFSRFNAENSNVQGTGIGLTITKRLVDLMGGTVGVESEVGVGSTFWFKIPINPG